MTKINCWQYIGLCALMLFPPWAMAQDATTPPKWGAHIDAEAKLGSKRSLGEPDLFFPLAQDARSLVFANLRGRFDDNDSREGNFGLGLRQMLESGWNLGAYGYFDRRRSDTGNYFNQASLGAEALGRDWDVRANAYIPLGDNVRKLDSTSTAALSGASVQVTTSNREERALKGFDAELGWRMPLFDFEARSQLRLYLGGYHFSDAVVTVEGPRIRAELALEDLPWFGRGAKLFLGAEAQHDSARGDQIFVSLRLRIPLGKEGTSLSRTSRLNAQERRMTAPVMRDVDIVTQSRVASPLVETATTTAGGQAITVLDSATTTGATLPGAISAAGANSTVILSGTFNTGTTPTTLQTGQTVMGAGTLTVTTPSGHTAVLATPSATIAGSPTGIAATIMMANSSTLKGLIVNDTASLGVNSIGISIDEVSDAQIINNTITARQTGTGDAIGMYISDNNSNITVSGNTIAGVSNSNIAIGIAIQDSSVLVTGNSLSGTSTVINPTNVAHTWLRNATIIAGSSGNTVCGGDCIIEIAGSGSPISYTNAPDCGP